MALSDITLSASVRASLINQQMVASLMTRTTDRLASGRKVNTPIDDPQAFFAAQDHMNRASDLSIRKDAMGEGIQTVTTADQGIKSITVMLQQAKGILASARSTSDLTERANLATQYDNLMGQIDNLANDASYRGKNLLDSDTLVIEFNEDGSSDLTITGFDASSSGLGINPSVGGFAADADIDTADTELDSALGTLRNEAQTLSTNLAIVTTRQDFAVNMINSLTTGADQLTLADTNEEGANMLALQTRQQLGTVSLSLSSQAEQSILRLF